MLTELALTGGLSKATDNFREALSHVSKHSKQITSQRVSYWVEEFNEPDSVSNQTQTRTVDFNKRSW